MSARFSSRLSAFVGTLVLMSTNAWAGMCPAFLNHDFTKLHSSETVNICKLYAGKPLLIVNTASHSGVHAAAFTALIRASRRRGAWLGGAFAGEDSFPPTDGVHLAADRILIAALTSLS